MTDIDKIGSIYGIETAAVILTCRVFAGTASSNDLAAYINKNNIDWTTFYTLISKHSIRPAVLKSLAGINAPDQFLQKLTNDCRDVAFRNFQYTKELVNIYTTCERSGIKVLPYKGPILSITLYGESGMRESRDIDLLIHYKDVEELKRVLEGIGYVDMRVIPPALRDADHRTNSQLHFDIIEGGNVKSHVELHWTVVHPCFDSPVPIPTDIIWDDTIEVKSLNATLNVPSPANHTVAIILHHGLKERWRSLKYILDLAQAAKTLSPNDWQKIFRLSHEYKFNKALWMGLSIIDSLLGIKINAPEAQPSEYRFKDDHFFEHRQKRMGRLSGSFYMKDDNLDKLRILNKYVGYYLAPNPKDYSFLPLPSSMMFLYAFIRPVRLLAGYFKRKQTAR